MYIKYLQNLNYLNRGWRIKMAKLFYQGHGSFRIITEGNRVIYVDPYVGEGYDIPADLILVTHQHGDHNQIDKVTQKTGCTVIQNQEALIDGVYQTIEINGIPLQAVPAYNSNQDRDQSVGYILTVDGMKVYATGDTSTTEEMKEYAALRLDYVLLPIDGVYNMNPKEASSCAELIAAKHAIPIHMKPGELFDEKMAEKFTAKNRLIVKAGEEIEL
jgi:L-ascorbate metabolism protein UlaG (beta-lactamase superfamily)